MSSNSNSGTQQRSSQEWMISLIILSGIGWLIFTYRALIAPLIIAGLIAYLLYPSVSWLAKKQGSHGEKSSR